MPATDYHALVAAAAKVAVDALVLGVTSAVIEDPEDVGMKVTLPIIGIVPVGPEQRRTEWESNVTDGIAWPLLIGHFTAGVTDGEKAPDGLALTLFRRTIHNTFSNKRALSAAANAYVRNCVCECELNAEIFDKDRPAFQKLRSYVLVYAVGRFPRS